MWRPRHHDCDPKRLSVNPRPILRLVRNWIAVSWLLLVTLTNSCLPSTSHRWSIPAACSWVWPSLPRPVFVSNKISWNWDTFLNIYEIVNCCHFQKQCYYTHWAQQHDVAKCCNTNGVCNIMFDMVAKPIVLATFVSVTCPNYQWFYNMSKNSGVATFPTKLLLEKLPVRQLRKQGV